MTKVNLLFIWWDCHCYVSL